MIRKFSKEFKQSVIRRADVEREPELYPMELHNAFKRLDSYRIDRSNGLRGENLLDIEYGVEGFIVDSSGVVGVHPSSSEEVKKEWMNYWRSRKERPFSS